jgi:hypothetical protein
MQGILKGVGGTGVSGVARTDFRSRLPGRVRLVIALTGSAEYPVLADPTAEEDAGGCR